MSPRPDSPQPLVIVNPERGAQLRLFLRLTNVTTRLELEAILGSPMTTVGSRVYYLPPLPAMLGDVGPGLPVFGAISAQYSMDNVITGIYHYGLEMSEVRRVTTPGVDD